MSSQTEMALEQAAPDAGLLSRLFATADRIMVKKLRNNDRDWAHNRSKHQAGVFIPVETRDSGFFPELTVKRRKQAGAAEIREAFFPTVWPQVGEERTSHIVHYTSKGNETHMTVLPKAAFADLLPASFLVMGRQKKRDGWRYECLTIDSGGDEFELLRDLFGLQADFVSGVFEPAVLRSEEQEKVLDFAGEVIAAWMRGEIGLFADGRAAMPTTVDLAREAQAVFMRERGLTKIDPFSLEAPGDDLRTLSRTIEWNLFREHQHRRYAVELVRLVMGETPYTPSPADIIRRLIDTRQEIDALMLSAGQQRKSRAGYSYEHHIEVMLRDGGIPFEKQVVLESKKRPDFILPSLSFVDSDRFDAKTGLILSAKTTLRERWKQVEREMGGRPLFLTTVDENIAGSVIEDMASIGVRLVIPESLLKAKEAEYSGHANVVGFGQFCRDFIEPHLMAWR